VRRLGGTLAALGLAAVAAFAENEAPRPPPLLLAEAAGAVAAGDRPRAEFYLARYVGRSLAEGTPIDGNALVALNERLGIRATAFLSPLVDERFVDWFVSSTYPQWDAPDRGADAERLAMIVAGVSDGTHFVQVVGSPALRSWAILGQDASSMLHVIDGSRPIELLSGTTTEGAPQEYFPGRRIDTGGADVHSVQRPRFVDLDGDGANELAVRYTVLAGNGFSQVLELFRIVPEAGLERVAEFRSGPEGFARLTAEGEVLVARAFPSRPDLGHLAWDRTAIERHRLVDGEWRKAGEEDVPNVLHSRAFEAHFLETPAP
jgi:hypothetical protein